jgi:preprotein translocase subunit Sss1
MAKTVATLVGVVFILVGIVGFFSPELMHAHLTKVHNVVHLVSGVVSLYFGTKGTLASARSFCIVFGLVYGLLGVVGYLVGTPDHMLKLSDPHFVLGPIDHYIHIAIGVLYLIGGFATKSGSASTA